MPERGGRKFDVQLTEARRRREATATYDELGADFGVHGTAIMRRLQAVCDFELPPARFRSVPL